MSTEQIPHSDLPVPELTNMRPVAAGRTEPKPAETVKHLDDLLDKEFLESYFKRKKS